jgi:hypothetical protein
MGHGDSPARRVSLLADRSARDLDRQELASPPGEEFDPVDTEDGDRLATTAVHGQEAALGGAAVLDGDLVPGPGQASELDPYPVLV